MVGPTADGAMERAGEEGANDDVTRIIIQINSQNIIQ
jgi:hypothetical protein